MACICDWLVLQLQVCGVAIDPGCGCKAYCSHTEDLQPHHTLAAVIPMNHRCRPWEVTCNRHLTSLLTNLIYQPPQQPPYQPPHQPHLPASSPNSFTSLFH